MEAKLCEHLITLEVKEPDARECEECVKSGGTWVHLRKCQTCGTTLCCNSSPNKHALKHVEATGHQVIVSAEPNERWSYCYEHHSFNPKAW